MHGLSAAYQHIKNYHSKQRQKLYQDIQILVLRLLVQALEPLMLLLLLQPQLTLAYSSLPLPMYTRLPVQSTLLLLQALKLNKRHMNIRLLLLLLL